MISRRRILTLVTIILALNHYGCDQRPPAGDFPSGRTIQSTHYRNLLDIYNSASYRWDDLESGVPPLLLRRFPNDIHLIQQTNKKKEFFFLSILPLALIGNEEIRQQRETVENILNIHDNGMELTLHQHEELIDIQNYYRVDGNVLTDMKVRAKLLRRIDTIPPSLVLAQAANESAWGMSRFAQHANNIFGEWTFTPGTGMVPEERPDGATYEVRRFKDLLSSIRSYMRNLNTHSAYRSMRKTRLRLREQNLPVTGYTLAGEMRYYSTRRDAYVNEIRAIITENRLQETKEAALQNDVEQPPSNPDRPNGGLMSSKGKISRQSKS